MRKYPIAKPHITEEDKSSVLAVLNSPYLSLGPKHTEFELLFAKFAGTRYACAVSSGTAGLHLVLLASRIRAGDEVITSPFSFVASSNAILYVGAKPVFVDIEPTTYNLDPAKIEEKITSKTKAILVVHIFGQSADMGPIMAIAKRHGLKVIEDACESLGARYRAKKVGTFGESAVFAFYPNKQITTGEGGMIVTNNKKICKLCRSLRNQGRTEDGRLLNHQRLGYNYRLDEMSAALGISQLKKIDFLISERRKIANWYTKCLSSHQNLLQTPRVGPGRIHTWFLYVVVLKKRGIRDTVIEKLDQQGIQTRPYFPSIHLFSFYQRLLGHKRGDFPVAEHISSSSLALPFYPGLQEKDIKYICTKLIKTLK